MTEVCGGTPAGKGGGKPSMGFKTGAAHGYLGHFAGEKVLRDGHNTGAHPGFKAVAAQIGRKSGIRNPGAVLAAASRSASPAAKKANPRLNRVKG